MKFNKKKIFNPVLGMIAFLILAFLSSQAMDVGAGINSRFNLVFDAEDVTATADEVNLNDGALAGTSVASKTLVLGASKNTDTLWIDDDLDGQGTATLTGFLSDTEIITSSQNVTSADNGKTFIIVGANAKVDLTLTASTKVLGFHFNLIVDDSDSCRVVLPGTDSSDRIVDGTTEYATAIALTAATTGYTTDGTNGGYLMSPVGTVTGY